MAVVMVAVDSTRILTSPDYVGCGVKKSCRKEAMNKVWKSKSSGGAAHRPS